MVPVKSEGQRLRRWDPLELFEEMQEEMARLWGETGPLAARRLTWPLRRFSPAPMAWMPRMDVYEKDNTLVVKAELPGVKKEDIEVAVDNGDLVIRGERQAEQEVKEENYYRMERTSGSFYRRLPLPYEVKPDQIEASFNDGVLEVRMPRPSQEKPQPQKVAIK